MTKLYTCTLLPSVTRDDPPKLGVRCNETGVKAAFWREEDRKLFLASPDLLEALQFALPYVAEWIDMFDPSDEADAEVKAARNTCREGYAKMQAAIAKATTP